MPDADHAKAAADALAGVLASLITLWVFYPIDLIKTRLQAGVVSVVHPKLSWISGLEWKSLHTACSSFCYFYLYSWVVLSWHRYTRSNSSSLQSRGAKHRQENTSVATRLLLAALAAILNTCITLPLDVKSARMQTSDESHSNDGCVGEDDEEEEEEDEDEDEEDLQEEQGEARTAHDPDIQKKPIERMWIELSEAIRINVKKVLSLWKGLGPSLLLCSNPAIHYAVYDSIKYARVEDSSLSMAEAFLLGMFAKFIATVATYPLIRAKVMLMVTCRTSMFQCLRDQYRSHGMAGLYIGFNIQLLHTVLKSALLMMIRERISKTAHRLVVVTTTTTTQSGT